MPLDVSGTPFQLAVWSELQKIPYGATCSYVDIARSLGKPGAARAVGMANHENPIAVVIPCHRVVGSDGSLTGYAGGLHLKQQLLGIENAEPITFHVTPERGKSAIRNPKSAIQPKLCLKTKHWIPSVTPWPI